MNVPALQGFFSNLFNLEFYLSNPWLLLLAAFQLWMLIDAIRRGEYFWALFIILFPGLNAILYFFLVYRASMPTRGFELPGAYDRRRIKELEAQIHHLDKAHHHIELGNIYFQHGKLQKAEQSYRAALEREPQDLEARAHLGQCLLRQGRPADALPLLEEVCREDPRHEYGYSLMALAETQMALKRADDAIQSWKQVLEGHSYARARVQLAELHIQAGQFAEAQVQLRETIADDAHSPAFERRRDKVWIGKAKRLLRRVASIPHPTAPP